MTTSEFIKIRTRLQLNAHQLAIVLGYSAQHGHMRIREFERGDRDIPQHIGLLMTAYDEGYRPKNWPAAEEAA